MRRQFVFAAATAAFVSAVLWAEPTGRQPAAPPVPVPVLLDEASAGTNPPQHWIPKQPGHYNLTDWRRVIDSTWGPGLPTADKLAIFDLFWEVADDSFACFNNLTVNWDSLRTVYRTEVEDSVSRGRFAAIMSQLARALMEAHTLVADLPVYHAALLPGIPLWVIGGWWYVDHFGAGLTPRPDSSLLVYRVVPSHPLGLEPGDLVLGYDRRPWTEILRELEAAQLPTVRYGPAGSSSSSKTHSLLNAAGMNWHLFDTIDIVKHSTGDTEHLPTSLLAGDSMHLLATEQMDIPGVPMPDSTEGVSATYGVVGGTRIGYIYCWKWSGNVEIEFRDAVSALVSDTTLKGMILDFRCNLGGNPLLSNLGLQLLFRDSVETFCVSARSNPDDHFAMKVTEPASVHVIPGNGVGYDKPIAVLVGPGAVSAGDIVAFRMKFHPRVRAFGKSTSTAFSVGFPQPMPPDWRAQCATVALCLASDTTYFLTHREFPVDVSVWHTPDAVARGEDTVVTAAMAWIDSAAAVAEEPEPLTAAGPPLTATLIRGALFVPERPGSSPSISCLLDISGRKVLNLRSGPNDVRSLAPGVYFVREASGARREASRVTKVVVTR